MFLLPAQKFFQRKRNIKICKTAKRKAGAEAEKNRTTERKEFFRGTSATQIKNSKQMPERQLYGAYCQNNSDQKDELVIYREFFRQADIICFWTACHNFCTFLQSKAKHGTKLENKDTVMLPQQ